MRGIGRSATLALACLGALVVLTVAIIGGPLPRLDEHVRHWAVTHQDPGVRRVATDVRWFGDVNVAGAILLVVAIAVSVRVRRWRLAVLPLGIAALTALAVTALKLVIGRSDAPSAPHAVLHADGHGFPSGHVATATVCWGVVAVILGATAPRVRAWLAVAATLVVLLVCWSVVYGPAHWLTDAMGGVLIGAAAVATFVALDGARLSKRRRS